MIPHRPTGYASHTLSGRDRFDTIYRDRLLCAYCIQNVNGYELGLEVAHYHTVLIAQRCNCMLVNFMYFRISIF